jgi:predicted phage terminase large subunit-like protein
MFGEFVSPKWNADDIVIRQRTKTQAASTISTTGVEAESTGSRADIIICDDLMGEQNYKTPESREKVKHFRRGLVDVLEPHGIMVDIMTRWHLDDTYSEIIEKEIKYYDVMVRKVVENGKLIYPKKFSKKFDPITKRFEHVEGNCLDYVEMLKATKPIDEFQSQYMNDPISSENALFKPEFFKYWEKRPEGLYVGMGVDLAISQRTEADYTAIVVVGMDKDWNLYVLDYIRGHWTPTDIIDNIFQTQSKWKPHTASMEINGFQRTLKTGVEEEMRRRNQYFGIEGFRAGVGVGTGGQVSKESRIKALEPFYRRGAVFHAGWMKKKDLETELMTFPKGRHDDLVDGMAQVLSYLSPGINTNADLESRPGTYDYVLREAQRGMNRYGSFFDHKSGGL